MDTLGAALVWVVIIGVIARALFPGRQPMWLGTTIALGIAGSLVGGLISKIVTSNPSRDAFDGAGWIMSIVGSLIVLWIAQMWNQPRRSIR